MTRFKIKRAAPLVRVGALAGIFLCCTSRTLPAEAPPEALSTAQALVEKGDLQKSLDVLNRICGQPSAPTQALYLRGYVLYRTRQLEPARKQLEQVVRLAPPSLRSRYLLGRIALLEGHPDRAIEWLLPAAGQNPPVEDAVAQLGKAYFDSHQLGEAREWTKKAIQSAPWDGALHYRLARIYQQTGESTLSADEFRKAAELKGVDRYAVQQLVECSQDLAAGDKEKALRVRDGLMKEDKLDPDVLVSLGTALASAGMAAEAVPVFEQAVRRDPTQFQAQFDLGLSYVKLGRAAEAVKPLDESLKLVPNSIEANSTLALSFVILNRFAEALPRLELIHSLQPNNDRTEALLGLAYLRTGQPRKAIPIVKAELGRNAQDPKLYFLLVESLNAADDQTAALAVCEEALQKFPDLGKAHLAKAQQLARLGKYQEAGPSFERAIELLPQNIEPMLGLAEVQNKAGQYDASFATYRRVLDLDPSNLTADLGASRDLESLGKFPEARDLLEKASSAHNTNSQVHIELARVYARLGARDLAVEQTRISQQLRDQETKQATKQVAPK